MFTFEPYMDNIEDLASIREWLDRIWKRIRNLSDECSEVRCVSGTQEGSRPGHDDA